MAGRIASSSDCTPRLIRFTPAWRYPASFSRVTLSGLHSTVISASSSTANAPRSAPITAAISPTSSSDGVPPPKKIVSTVNPPAHGAAPSNSISRDNAPRYRDTTPRSSTGAVLNEQYSHRRVQNGTCTYTPTEESTGAASASIPCGDAKISVMWREEHLPTCGREGGGRWTTPCLGGFPIGPRPLARLNGGKRG